MFVHYTLIGGFATATHFAVLVVLVEQFGLPVVWSTTIGAACGASVAYLANRRFTFSGATRHRLVLPRFLIVAVLGAAANGLIVWFGTGALRWHYLTAQAVATAAALALTFRLNRDWTFA